MSFETLVLALALLLGPALAAAGVIVLTERQRVYERRLHLFHDMMRMRRVWLSPEWAGGLNLAPVEFAAFPPVIAAVDALLTRYGDPAWQSQDGEKRRRAVLDTETAACELLLRMAEALRIPMVGSDLRTRPNAPYGWTLNDIQERQTRDMLAQVLSGVRPLRVETFAQAQAPASAPRGNAAAPSNAWYDAPRASTLQTEEIAK
ncbi:MAG TPA: DUF6680 family protein [Caulobacterales bacterium]|nr:DUF6680 family protein [Caulobacterales bacterium]